MIRYLRSFLSYAGILAGAWGCNVASAADGAASSTPGALGASSTDSPPSFPVDAPPAPHKPPQEAFDACKSHSEGDACSVSFNGHTMNGTCRKGPDGDATLVCAPAHPPGPPPEAVEACNGLAEGATCSVSLHGETLTGTCRKDPRDGNVIACMPAHPPGAPPGSNQTITSLALEHKLDQLERDIHSR